MSIIIIGILLLLIITSSLTVLLLPANQLIVFSKIYVICRDNGKPSDRILSTGFMRGTSPPWYTGTGVQLRIRKTVIQVGFCKKGKQQEEDEGILSAMGGRYLDVTAKDIREW